MASDSLIYLTTAGEYVHPTELHEWAKFAIALLQKLASEVQAISSQYLQSSDDIESSMDLGNVQMEICKNSYQRFEDCMFDVRRVFENAAIDTNLPPTIKPDVEDVLSLFDQACKERSLKCFGVGVDSSDDEGSSSDFGAGGADINFDSDQGGMDQDGDDMDQDKRTTNFSDGTLGRLVQRHIEDDERRVEISAKAMTEYLGKGADDVKQFVYEASDNESEAKSHPFILDQAEEAESDVEAKAGAMAIELVGDGGGEDDETGDTREEDELTECVVDEFGADILLEMKHSSQNSKVVDLFDGSDDEGEDSSASEVSAIL